MTSQTYSGSCHCDAVRFEAEVDLDNPVSCNCSRCRRLGILLAFTPPERFRLLSGEDQLTEYRFNKHVISHLFCRICGIESFARGTTPDGKPVVAINVRCLEGVDPDSLSPMKHDGASA